MTEYIGKLEQLFPTFPKHDQIESAKKFLETFKTTINEVLKTESQLIRVGSGDGDKVFESDKLESFASDKELNQAIEKEVEKLKNASSPHSPLIELLVNILTPVWEGFKHELCQNNISKEIIAERSEELINLLLLFSSLIVYSPKKPTRIKNESSNKSDKILFPLENLIRDCKSLTTTYEHEKWIPAFATVHLHEALTALSSCKKHLIQSLDVNLNKKKREASFYAKLIYFVFDGNQRRAHQVLDTLIQDLIANGFQTKETQKKIWDRVRNSEHLKKYVESSPQ